MKQMLKGLKMPPPPSSKSTDEEDDLFASSESEDPTSKDSESMPALADLSDSELVAECKRRGLKLDDKPETSMDSESMPESEEA